MNKKLVIAVLAILVFALMLSACGSKEADQTAAPAAESSESSETAAQPTPPFSFTNFQPTQGINTGAATPVPAN